MDKLISIMDSKLFTSAETIELRGIRYEAGLLRTGARGLKGIYLDSEDPRYHEKLNYAITNQHAIGLAIDLPAEAADMWLESYNEATIAGHNGVDAESIAWECVNKHYYKDASDRWVKLAESWAEEVTKQIEPIIEIVKVGKFRGSEEVDITSADLDNMIKNFDAGMRRPPITNDHRQFGPSFGGVKKLFRNGERLFAQLTNLTQGFINAVRNHQYTDRSIEFYKDYVDGEGKHYGALLDAISFLGAKTPAVKGMALPAFSENGMRFAFSIDNEQVRGRVGLPIDESANNIRIRQKDPELFSEFRYKTFSDKDGIRAVMGKLKSSDEWEVESIIFAKDKGWDEAKSKSWIEKNGYKISASEPSNNQKKGVNLGEITIKQEDFDAKIEAAVEKGRKAALSEVEAKQKADEAERKKADDAKEKELAETKQKLADEQAANKKRLAEETAAKAQDEAVKLYEHYSSEAGGGKLTPAMKDNFVGQFKAAILSEDKEALAGLKKQVEAFPPLVKFGEQYKDVDKDGNHEIGSKLNLSEADKTRLEKVEAYMKAHGYKFSVNGGLIQAAVASEYVEAVRATESVK
jgi:hypothetical protein